MAEPPEFQSLFITARWVEAHCIVPDGFDKGKPFILVDWQLEALLNFYRLKPTAQVGELAAAFHFRRSQIVLPQKAGKAPYTGSHICVEAVGPALFAGWAEGGEIWDCRNHGCGCGWEYEYEPGEAMGMPWPTPLIQITATSEEQTDNIYDALRPMIDDGPLHDLIPKTGEEFIRLPGKGRIDVVTSSATSRLGQRVTFVPQDETGVWNKTNGMVKVAETQRRGLAGMGGRSEETTNAWDPGEQSVAQRTAESRREDIYRIHPIPPKSLSYRNKQERRKIHRLVYEGCKWVNLDSIEAEASELLETDPAQAERFFGNRVVSGSGAAFDDEAWDRLATDYEPAPGALIVAGIDGARFDDALAIIGTEVETGFQWPIGIWEKPAGAPDEYEHPMDEVDGAMIDAEERFDIWRIYIDPGSSTGNIDPLVEKWQGRWGDKRVIRWLMHRPRQTAFAVSSYTAAINSATLSHDGSDVFSRHIKNAVKWPQNIRDDDGRRLHLIGKDRPNSPNKMDAAAAGVLSWEARGDAIAAGATNASSSTVIFA
jgi:hypothetical protein